MLKTAVFSLLLAPAAVSAADAACHSIKDQIQRLACYDKAAEAVVNCASEKDKLDRLVCFDKLGKPMKALAQSKKALPPQAKAPEAANERFGLSDKRPEEPEAIKASVSKLKQDPYGKFIITLDNGQVWKQIDSKRFRFKKDKPVTIEKASLGSFMLTQEGSSKSARVKRVQ
ncbi:hypothetical protein [Ferrimonas sp. YFM]|uniref:hypothetical protein n=1 Tax=Ferrimonas sp. YFM TaxID=3028878 RepID=UPI0025722E31|nr:hypothetical protein [Ferrimonas sp. YFM]BDY06808.1 hypothetical protein F0521_38490 [Ferrimonas sp. YFM]